MSERFPNKALKQAYEAFDDAYNEVYWGTTTPTVEVVAAAQAAGFAAMRAVLEGHENAQIVRLEAHVAMQADVIKDLAGPVEELENLAYERGRQERIRTMCPECGPNVKIDEDGCCTACGHDVTEVTRSCDSCNGTGWLSHRDDHVPCGCVIGQRRAASDGEPQPAALDRVRDVAAAFFEGYRVGHAHGDGGDIENAEEAWGRSEASARLASDGSPR